MVWESEFASLLKKENKDQDIILATVVSVSPFVLHMYDLDVKKHIYINPDESFKYGDQVIAVRDNISFYILGKVVKAT